MGRSLAGPSGLRFSPPALDLGREERWVLLRAFAAIEAPLDGPLDRSLDGDRAVSIATGLGLAARIADRAPGGRLAAEIGAGPAETLTVHRWAAVARGLQGAEAAAQVAAVAAAHRAPLVLLKGAGLQLAGVVAAASRPAADLDVLLPARAASAVHTALTDRQAGRDFEAAAAPANEQHLPPLVSPRLGAVDVHFRLRGITLGDGWATAEEVLQAGLCRPLGELAGECFAPGVDLAAAHAVAHGVEQHGRRPHTYPLARMIADLVDLAAHDGARPVAEILAAGSGWLRDAVSAEELAAAACLADRLAAGRLPLASEAGADDAAAVEGAERDAATLLAHLFAALDPGYGPSLRFGHLIERIGSAHRQGELGRYLSRKLAPPASGRGVRYSLARLAHALGGVLSRLRGRGREGG